MKHNRFLKSIRSLLGIRKRRGLPPTGPKPHPGARVCSGDVRFKMPAGMSDALWQWLSALGWREITLRPDRRRYMDISEAWAQRLCEAQPQQWPQVVLDATVAARARAPHPDAFSEVPMKRQGHRLPHSGRPKR
jgi:hypothetical protein